MSPARRVLLINPNTTEAMTQAMASRLGGLLDDTAVVQAVTAGFGCAVIASRVSYAVGAHAAIEALARQAAPWDAVVLGCFGDPGLEALREMTGSPVVGLAEASFDAAARIGAPFAVLTFGQAWETMLEERLVRHPAAPLCRAIRALDGTGLDAADLDAAARRLDGAAHELAAAAVEVVILGGAALAGFGPRLAAPVRFLDPVEAAAESLRALL